jgi:hypothetical protein
MMPHARIIDVVRDGVTVGQLFDYGEETGEQSFDVVVGGVVSGRVVRWASGPELPAIIIIADNILSIDEAGRARRGNRVWRLAEATGVLASFADRRWTVQGSERPNVALADIRAGLETTSRESDG